MSFLLTVWGLLFRLLPCPTRTGLRRIGRPIPSSPVLATCNFDLTVKRLRRVLERDGIDAWLLVCDSKGVNVWCAAGADELSSRSVVSAMKTSGIADLVDHRTLVLPPLAAPAVRAAEVEEQTGWRTRWGPVYAADLPRFLATGHRDEAMKRTRFAWRERLDSALGSMFPFFLGVGLPLAVIAPGLVVDYLVVGAATFVLFYLACPWLPGRRGITKALLMNAGLGLVLVLTELAGATALRADLILAMVFLAVWGLDLGGISSTLPSDFDPFLARLGVGAIGNTAFAGTVRTDLLNGRRELALDRDRCTRCRQCSEVCPRGVWERDADGFARLAHPEDCTACRACLTQCPSGAIEARRA